ncbi:MAG: hypothetical protein Q4A35_00205 [Candidatus Gracilibacteria bacterium]|nr:hypothetical protein [Candidatus Gracilibacteria bacterium]
MKEVRFGGLVQMNGTLNIKTRKNPYPFSVMESMKFLRELHIFVENGIIVGETAITG